jgi:hypothetical protein
MSESLEPTIHIKTTFDTRYAREMERGTVDDSVAEQVPENDA